jgi:signal transduction histidine kinase
LEAIKKAIDETAGGAFESSIDVSRTDELGHLASAVGAMRERLSEMNRQMAESLRFESLRMLGSILVHDIKNLSFRLRTASYNVQNNYDDPKFRESLVRTLDATSEQMESMVRRFREQGETVIVKLRIDLNALVQSVLENLKRDATGLRITEEYAELPQIWADTMLLENAVFNIVENARDAMPHGGHLAVRTFLTEVGSNAPRKAIVEIADSGVGMSQEFIRKELASPFVTTKPRGLGLGLYTSRQIVQMHDGEIIVYSEIGRGTIFKICLPVSD